MPYQMYIVVSINENFELCTFLQNQIDCLSIGNEVNYKIPLLSSSIYNEFVIKEKTL